MPCVSHPMTIIVTLLALYTSFSGVWGGGYYNNFLTKTIAWLVNCLLNFIPSWLSPADGLSV